MGSVSSAKSRKRWKQVKESVRFCFSRPPMGPYTPEELDVIICEQVKEGVRRVREYDAWERKEYEHIARRLGFRDADGPFSH